MVLQIVSYLNPEKSKIVKKLSPSVDFFEIEKNVLEYRNDSKLSRSPTKPEFKIFSFPMRFHEVNARLRFADFDKLDS